MSAQTRLSLIKQILINEKKASVADLSKKFSVTEETIRRDLDKLETEGILTRTYGGAVLNMDETVSNIPFYRRAEHNLTAKQDIAIAALEILKGATTIFADSSSTVMETLKLLKNREDLTVVTNSSEALKEFIVSDVNVLSTGGQLNKRGLSLQGDLTEKAIEYYNVDLAVISCKGINQSTGVTDTNEVESGIKRKMIQQADKVVLLADHGKFGKKAFVHLMSLEEVDYIVTDQKPEQEWLDYCRDHDTTIIF